MMARNVAQVIAAAAQSAQSEPCLQAEYRRADVRYMHLLLAFHLNDKLLKI
jgi:hypothetical protein